jgi:hypothetical protein
MTDTISNEELLARYEALCAASDRHANDGWRSSHEDGLKRSLTITAAQLDHFADMVIGGIGFEPIKDSRVLRPPSPDPSPNSRGSPRSKVTATPATCGSCCDAPSVNWRRIRQSTPRNG